MKKFILIIVFLGLTIGANAQSQKMKERTAVATEYVAKAMNLDDAHKTFLYETVLNGSETVRVKLKSAKGNEESKAVHKQGREDLKKALSAKFSSKEIKQIETLLKEYKKQSNTTK